MSDFSIDVEVPVDSFDIANSLATHEYKDIIDFVEQLSKNIADTTFDDLLLELAQSIVRQNKADDDLESNPEYSDELMKIFKGAKQFVEETKRILKDK